MIGDRVYAWSKAKNGAVKLSPNCNSFAENPRSLWKACNHYQRLS